MAGNRKGSRGGRTGAWHRSGLVWLGGLALLLGLLIVPMFAGGSHHPEPRADVGHEHVVPAARYAAYPRVAQIYQKVAEVPHVIDGIYCYCDCSQHSGHYSLLDCFHDDHAARCDICLSEADMAHRMHQEGRSLDEIRTTIDRLYQS